MRRSLTPKERQAMLAKQKGLCALCKAKLEPSSMIAEHSVAVALGNENKPDCLVCAACAREKTFGKPSTTYGADLWAIAKAKRLARKREGTWRQPKARIASRGFPERPAGQWYPDWYKYQWPKRKVGQ